MKQRERMNMTSAIEQTVRRVFDELWNQQKVAVADELFSAKTSIHFSYEQAANLQDFKEALQQWYKAFPDLLHQIDDLIVIGMAMEPIRMNFRVFPPQVYPCLIVGLPFFAWIIIIKLLKPGSIVI